MFRSKTHGQINLKQKIIKTITLTIVGALVGLSLGIVKPGEVHSAPSSYLNFQARLLNANGSIVPDGNYHVEFKLYNVSTGGSALWTETRTTGNLVSVKSGYLSVYLGSVTAFPTTINWNEEHWVTMNIGGSGGSASWDGEMTPRIKMTAVPYAFQAGKLAKTSGANRGTLAFDTVANNPDILLPDASGTVCLASTSACGFIIGSGTAFIQGGNDFGGTTAGNLGTVNNGNLNLITNNISRLSVSSAGDVSIANNLAVNTTTLVVDAVNDRVGIGTASPASKLHVVDSSTSTTGSATNGVLISVTDTGIVTSGVDVNNALSVTSSRTGATGGSIYNIAGNFSATGDTGGSSQTIGISSVAAGADESIGVLGTSNFVNTTTTNLIGVRGSVHTFVAGGTVTNAYALQGFIDTSSAVATITNATGLNIDSALKNAGGTITNNYGIKVANQTVGTNDYGLYIEGADTYALWVDSGATRLDGTLEVQTLGTTNTDSILCRNSSNQLAGCNSTFVTSTTGFVQGGNSFGTTATLGTNDTQSLVFETDNVTRLTINTSGDATLTGNLTVSGAGTSSFAGNLSVNKHASVGAGAQIDASTITSSVIDTTDMISTLTVAETVTDFSKSTILGVTNLLSASPATAYGGNIIGGYQDVTVGGSSSVQATIGNFSKVSTSGSVDLDIVFGNYNSVGLSSTGDITSAAYGNSNSLNADNAITGALYGSSTSLSSVGAGSAVAGAFDVSTSGNYGTVYGTSTQLSVSSGTITGVSGQFASLDVNSGAVVTDVNGLNVYLQSASGSTVTNSIGLNLQPVAHSGTVTNAYGAKIGTVSGATNNYGLAVGAASTQTLWVSSNADNTTAAAGIAFGSSRDTNLYRSAANNLMTDDSFTIAGNLNFTKETAHTIKINNSTTATTAGALLSILGADGNSAAGGGINITGGTAGGFQNGGDINLTGGTGFGGGNVNINGGTSGFAPGNVVIQGKVTIASTGNSTFDTNTLFVDAVNHRVSIGTASPTTGAKLTVSSSSTNTTADTTYGAYNTVTDTGIVTTGTDTTNGLSVSVTRTGATGGTITSTGGTFTVTGDTGGSSTATGVDGRAWGSDSSIGVSGTAGIVGVAAVDSVIGINGLAGTILSVSATATNLFGLQGAVGIDGGIATITNAAGLNIKSATNVSGGTITNNYGIKVANQTVGTNDYGLYIEGADTYALWVDSGATRLDGTLEVQTLGTTNTDSILCRNSSNQLAGCNSTFVTSTTGFVQGGNSFGTTATLGTNDTQSLVFETDNITRATFDTSNSLYLGNGVSSATPSAFTVSGTQSSATGVTGGALTLQGGNATAGNANGGNLVLNGGSGFGTGVKGLVVLSTPTISTSSTQSCATSCNITQANIDSSGAVLINATASGVTATLTDPTITTAGRIMYVTNIGSNDFTLSVNGGGSGNLIAMKPNTTATMIWNGADWTAAGASSSTDLQSAYNNTLTSAGGAELVLNAPGGSADGLTIRNNDATPISGGILEVQSSIGTNLFSVNNFGTELSANGGAETSGTFSTNWTAAPAGGTVTRTTTAGQFVTGNAGVQVVTTSTANTGVRNNLSGNPVNTIGAQYQVSFTAKSTLSGTPIDVQYSRDGGTTLTACTNYGGVQTLSNTVWTKITCTITIASATAASNPDLIIRKTGATTPTIYIDNLSFIRNDTTTQPSNVQIGGGINGGQVTLFTLDRSSAPPVAAGDSTYFGSMYYDTTSGRIQCYESDGWGACGSAPDNIITLTPEYTGAVLNGSGIGTMTADFCGNGGGLSANTSFCASGEARNYYKWTSPQATDQTYSVYVNYKLPTSFKTFADDNTIKLTAYKDDASNASASLEVYRKNVVSGSISQCGSTTTITTSTSSWNTTSLGGSGETTCGWVAGDYVIFKINVTAKSNANVYVENLDFTYFNQ